MVAGAGTLAGRCVGFQPNGLNLSALLTTKRRAATDAGDVKEGSRWSPQSDHRTTARQKRSTPAGVPEVRDESAAPAGADRDERALNLRSLRFRPGEIPPARMPAPRKTHAV